MDLVTLTQSSFGEAESNSSVEMPLDPSVVGSFNLQVQVYVKHPAIWHRNDRPSQLKHPRVGRRETLSHLLCTPEEDALLFEVTNACGDITVNAKERFQSLRRSFTCTVASMALDITA